MDKEQEAHDLVIQTWLPRVGMGLSVGGTLTHRLSRSQMATSVDVIRSEIYTEYHTCLWRHDSGSRDTRQKVNFIQIREGKDCGQGGGYGTEEMLKRYGGGRASTKR